MSNPTDPFKHPNARYYDLVAAIYDKYTGTPGAWAPPSYLAAVVERCGLAHGRVLDVGIGTGQSIAALYDRGHRNIVGVDCSVSMLDECRKKYPELTLIESRFKDADLTTLTPFDLVLSSGAFDFMEDLPLTLSKCASLLSSGGSLLFTYEPLIEGHELQSEAASGYPAQVKPHVPDFITYRHRPSSILTWLKTAGLHVELDEELVSYRKANVIDVIQHCVWAKKG